VQLDMTSPQSSPNPDHGMVKVRAPVPIELAGGYYLYQFIFDSSKRIGLIEFI
jgi:hypothetical protein